MELLDDITVVDKKKPIFSIIAIVMSLMFIAALYYIGDSDLDGQDLVKENFVFILTVVSFIIAVLSAFFSFVRMEKPTAIRWIGGVLNLLIIVIMIISILYS